MGAEKVRAELARRFGEAHNDLTSVESRAVTCPVALASELQAIASLISESPTQILAYMKRIKTRCRGILSMDSFCKVIHYAKGNNFLKLVTYKPVLSDHHVGVILVYKGQVLAEDNQFRDLPLIPEHHQTNTSETQVTPYFNNLMAEAADSAMENVSDLALSRITSCIRECLRQCTGKKIHVSFGASKICARY